ncbi:MAG: hypothetical protein KDD50_05885, partial [Bdellovibrionales bacterium]|nr:hypothetical protein [Bdellovibrionales bacterium]
MKKKIYILFIVFLIFFSYGLVISQFDLKIIVDELKPKNPEGFFDYRGVVNVHSIHSTGSGSVQKIIRDAQEEGLDFISIADFNSAESTNETQGYHNNLFVFFDKEYSYLNSRLINYFSKEDSLNIGPGRQQVFIADSLEKLTRDKKSGLWVLSHPFQRGYEWQGNYPAGLDGIEVLNLKSIWENYWLKSTPSFLWTLFVYPFNSDLAFIRLFEYPENEIQLWDTLNKTRKTLGFAGSDAEEKILLPNKQYIKIPKYKDIFQIANNHVLLESELTGDPLSDEKKLRNALKSGNFYFSFDLLANPKGFASYIEDSNGNRHLMGSEIKYKPGQVLHIILPQKPFVPF